MRRIFPLKPVCATSNPLVPNSNPESVQRDKNGPQPKRKSTTGRGKDDMAVVDCHGKDTLKELKENSLGAQMRLENFSPLRRSLPPGEKKLPFVKKHSSRRVISNVKRGIGEETGLQKVGRCSISGSSNFFSPRSSISIHRASYSSAGDVYNFGLLQDTQSTSPAGASDDHMEEKGKKHITKNSKLTWTRRSISIPKQRPEETNKTEIPVFAKSNSFKMAKVPHRIFDFHKNNEKDKSTSGKPQQNARDEDLPNTIVDQSPLLVTSEDAPVEGVKFGRSQSISNLTDSYNCFSNATGKTSPKKSRSSVMKGVFSSTGDSIADKISYRCQSARTFAAKLNYKSLLTKGNSFDMKKSFDWQNVIENEDKVGAATEVSVSASDFLNPRSSCTEEELSSFILFEDSPFTRSQSPSSNNHQNVNENMSGTFDSFYQTGISKRSATNSSSKKENTDRLRMWLEGYQKFEDIDELERKARAAEENAQFLSKEMESMKPNRIGPTQKEGPKKADMNMHLQKQVRKLSEEKRNLYLEVASEIRSRMSERSAANEALKLMKGEMESRVQMAQKEKNALQLSLENELDRRSCDWKTMLEKIRMEEKRLRDRVRDLAEQNVALQREVSHLNDKENDSKIEAKQSELYANELKKCLEAESEIALLRRSFTESQKRIEEAEDARQSVQRSYELRERENYALQRSIVRLQRLCKDHERTITGLCKGLDDEINNIPQEKNDHITKLQNKLLKMTGEEEAVYKNKENCRSEADAMRHGSKCLLERKRSMEESRGYGLLIKVDQELRSRIDELYSQVLSLLDENSMICAKLLEITKYNMCHNDGMEINGEEKHVGFSTGQDRECLVENEMNVQILKRKADSLSESIHMVKGILKQKTLMICNQTLRQEMEKTNVWHSEQLSLKTMEQLNELQLELKAKTMFSRVLCEKLYSKEDEVERLQDEVTKFMQIQEVLKTKIGRLQNLLSDASHNARELEYQLKEKEERISSLENDLPLLKEEISKVAKERDMMLQRAEQLDWESMRLNAEIEAFQKKLEKQDEDLMLKDGQISILKASLDELEFSEGERLVAH